MDRARGCLLGLAVGDAVGTTLEFQPRDSYEPLTDMVGGGPFGLEPGQWTDDTSMALCLAFSLIQCRDILDLQDHRCLRSAGGQMFAHRFGAVPSGSRRACITAAAVAELAGLHDPSSLLSTQDMRHEHPVRAAVECVANLRR